MCVWGKGIIMTSKPLIKVVDFALILLIVQIERCIKLWELGMIYYQGKRKERKVTSVTRYTKNYSLISNSKMLDIKLKYGKIFYDSNRFTLFTIFILYIDNHNRENNLLKGFFRAWTFAVHNFDRAVLNIKKANK